MQTIHYFFISVIMILVGIGIQKYLKKYQMNNIRGMSVFYLKFASVALILFGAVSLIAFLVSFYLRLA